ncbi:MarR family transcriptional regulator [Herbiconiux sp. 11R-BC]|uniref:MarR family winged helix-turn-helix transcriptional regulator n=1 Tax=Herbiconiux sp. 11R-BC TaxID=3111637 RepID=UPI003C0285C4
MTYTEFFRSLVVLQTELWYHVDGLVREALSLDLANLESLSVLGALEGRGRVQDLADTIGITPGAASKLVDRLETRGLVARQSNPADRRSSVLALTAEGQALLAEFSPLLETILRDRLAPDLDEEQRSRFIESILVLRQSGKGGDLRRQ